MSNLLSRTISLSINEKQTVLSPRIPHNERWRLAVAETSKTGLVKVTVTLLHAQTSEVFTFSIGSGGATAKEFAGSAIVEIEALLGPITVTAAITEAFDDIVLNELCEDAQNLAAPWIDLGSNGGFLPPYYSYVSIYPTWTHTDIQLVDFAGANQWTSLNIPSTSMILNQFRMPSAYRLQAKGVGRITVSWSNRR